MRFTIPAFAEIDVAQILRDAPDGLRVRLHKNELDPEAEFTPNQLVAADFNGNPWEEVAAPAWEIFQGEQPDRITIQTPLLTWEKQEGGTPQSVWGWSLWWLDGLHETFLGAEQWDAPLSMEEAGDTIERFFRFESNVVNLV